MAKKPRLSFWEIWNMSFGFLGIQFGFALQNANVSRIFETLGADVEDIPILWIAAPVTGLIVQPIIGYFSDRTWNRLGRRRPYFLFGAIFASIALFIMPNSPSLWIAAGMLWIMDASINVSMEPFRAFVGDNLPSEQRTTGFAMQSFFIGLGAVIASYLPYMFTNWFGISNEAPKGIIPPSVKWSFYVGAIVFFLAVLWTVFRSKEYPPEELAAFEEDEKDDEYEKEALTAEAAKKKGKRQIRVGKIILALGAILTIGLTQMQVDKQIFIFGFGLIFVGAMFLFSGILQSNGNFENGFVTIMNDLQDMPLTMKQLAWVQFFSWFALFCMWLYTTAGVTSDKYGMKVNAQEVQYLKEVVNNMEGEDQKELAKIKEDLSEIEDKFVAGVDEVVIPVNLANYFLEGKLVKEEELVEKALGSIDQIDSKGESFEKAKKELENLQDQYSDGVEGNEKIITFSTFDFLQKNSGTLFRADGAMIGEPLKMAHRLKFVQKEYNDGADWVGVCFAVYNGMASLFAFFLMWLAKVTNRKMTHSISLLVGAISFVSIFFIANPWYLLISFIGIGLAWASILAMPYAILTGSIPSDKMGYYMGVFNFFIVIPQILAATILGFLVAKVFDGQAIYISLVAAGAFALAALLTMRVYDKDDVVG